MKPSQCRSFLLASAALLAACGGEVAIGPEPAAVFSRLEITPNTVQLILAQDGNVVQLAVRAWDQADQPLLHAGPATFWSSDTTVARVDNDGRVTVLRPGVAIIRARLTLGGQTREGAMTIVAQPPPADGLREGVYDFTGVVDYIGWDWYEPNPMGDRYFAVMTLQGTGGGYAELRRVESRTGATVSLSNAGFLTRELMMGSTSGRVRVTLWAHQAGGRASLMDLWVREEAPGFVGGWFQLHDDHGAWGTFEAWRR